jgi:hypothetical protein
MMPCEEVFDKKLLQQNPKDKTAELRISGQ